MTSSNQKGLDQLNKILDKMIVSESFRQRASQSGLDILVIAAKLIEANHPQLSPINRHLILQQFLEATETLRDHTDATHIAHLLTTTQPPQLSNDSRNRIFDTMMGAVTQPSNSNGNGTQAELGMSDTQRDRIFDRVLQAQQRLQTNALIDSDDALDLAQSSDDSIIQAAVRLRTAAHPQLSAASKQRIAQQILPEPVQHRSSVLRPDFSGSMRRIAASIAIIILIATIGIPPVAAASVPGDQLYPVKRSIEVVSLQFAFSTDQRTVLHLDHAYERLNELQSASLNRQQQDRLLGDAITSLEQATALSRSVSEVDIVQENNLAAALVAITQAMTDTGLESETASDFMLRLEQVAMTLQPPQFSDASEPEMTPEPTDSIVEPSATPVRYADAVMLDTPIEIFLNATARVNVREAAANAAPIITQVTVGESLTQLGQNEAGTWTLVELANRQTGWIAAFLLSEIPITPKAPDIADTDSDDTPTAETNNQIATTATANTPANDTGGSDNGSGTSASSGNSNGNANGNANGNSNGNNNPQGQNGDDGDDDDDDD